MCQPRISHGLGLFTESTLAEEPHIALLQSACRVGMMFGQQASEVRHPAQEGHHKSKPCLPGNVCNGGG